MSCYLVVYQITFLFELFSTRVAFVFVCTYMVCHVGDELILIICAIITVVTL